MSEIDLTDVGTLNPNNNYPQTHFYFDSSDDPLAVVEQLNDLNLNSISYPSLVGLVVAVDNLNVGNAPPKKRKAEDKENPAPTPIQRSVAYVYIDTVHSSIRKIINSKNSKNLLTRVEIIGPSIPSIKSRVLVSFKSNDLSEATLVRFIDSTEQQTLPEPPTSDPRTRPCVEVKKPMAKSTPVRAIYSNVGYVQALYVLARWQTKNTNYKITEIVFPFEQGDETGDQTQKRIFSITSKFKDLNDKTLKDVENNSNPQKQWVTLVKGFLGTNVRFDKNSGTSGIIVKYETSVKSPVDLNEIGDSTGKSGYYAKDGKDKNTFILDFARDLGTAVGLKLRLTQKNLQKFKNELAKVVDEPFSESTTKPTVSVKSISCGKGARTVLGNPGPHRYFRVGNTAANRRYAIRQGWRKLETPKRKKGWFYVDEEWEKKYIVTVPIKFPNGKTWIFKVHRAIEKILPAALKEAFEVSGYSPDKQPWSYAPRHINRDPAKPVSVHAYGFAIDIDAPDNLRIKCKNQNRLADGTPECVKNNELRQGNNRKFVDIMNKHGFLWGGDYTYRDKKTGKRLPYPDDHHFEFDISRLKIEN